MILDRAVEPEIIGSGCVLQPLESSHPADVEPSDNDQWTEFRPPEALDSGPPLDVTTDRRKGPGMVVRVIPQSPPTGPIWLRLSFRRQEGERFFGFGERSDRVERSGGVTEHWVGEGPYQLGEYSLMQAITPRWGMRRRLDATYFPVPWLLSSRGYGVLTENSEISYHVLDRQDQWSVHVRAAELCLRVFPAANPAEALRAFTEYSGRQPVPPASWHYGPWVQTGHSNEIPAEEEESHLAALAAAAVPIQAVETHLRYLPGGAHREVGRRQTERERTGRFKGRGLPSLSYLNPMVTEDFSDVFDQAAQAGAFLRHPDGSPYSFLAYVGGRNPPLAQEAQLDFTNPAGVKTFKDIAAELLEDGHVGWMEDFGEYTPVDSVAYDGTPGERMHNLYPVAFHRAGHRVASELAPNQAVARFARSGWAGAAPYVPIVWGGDPTTSWGFDGLSSAVIEALSMGLSGIAIWGTDIGGFFSLGDNALTIELLIRWIQFGALCPVMRTKAGGVMIPPGDRPQVWDSEVVDQWAFWSRFHVDLHPYFDAAAREYAASGMPILRHHLLTHPEDDVASALEDQFMIGPKLLAAPVLEPSATHRRLYVPAGRWVDWWTGEEIKADGWITQPVDLERFPLFQLIDQQ